ncbi:MAG TPA: DNA polymerase [Actinomycetota bacterium]|nr:DNA polymerase [Actinomycetota bacterium]
MSLLFGTLPEAVRPLRDLPPAVLRPSAWVPPTEFLDLTGVGRISVDVERKDPDLNRLGPGTFRGARICGLAVGTDDGRRAYYPVAHEGGGNCEWNVWGAARGALNAFTGEVVGAKLIYDLEALAHEQRITFPAARGFHDVQLAEAVIDEWRFRYGLDALARDYLNESKVEGRLREIAALRRWDGNELKGNLYRLAGGDCGEYGEGDVDLPLRILPLQLRKLEADGQLSVYDLERRLIPVLLAMRLRGVRVAPTDRISEVRDRMLAEAGRWEREVHRLLGPSANPASSDTLGQPLVDRGLPVPRSPKGKWSVTKEFLEKNAGDAAVNAIAACRRVSTLVSLTLDSMLDHLTTDGRLHCEFNQLKGEDENGKLRGSIARLSSSHSNLQQIPTRQSEFDHLLFSGDFDVTTEIRGLFLPDEGEVWECADESQVELRLLANFAVGPGSAEVRAQYNDDPTTDYHKWGAERMRIDPEDMKKRKRLKNFNFSYVYGAGDDKMAVTFNCPPPEATAFRLEVERELPFIKATYHKAAEWAIRRGYVETVLGRKCRFPFWEPRGNRRGKPGYVPPLPLERARVEYAGSQLVLANSYKALNRKLQGSGADILKKAMVDAHEAGLTSAAGFGAFLLTAHDELDQSIPPTRGGAEAAAELKRIMETCVEMRVPLRVKVEHGPSWGEVA